MKVMTSSPARTTRPLGSRSVADASGEKKSVSVPSNWTSVFARANGGMTDCWYPVGVMPAAMSLRPISIAPFCVCAAIFWSSDFGGHRPPSEKSKSVFGAP